MSRIYRRLSRAAGSITAYIVMLHACSKSSHHHPPTEHSMDPESRASACFSIAGIHALCCCVECMKLAEYIVIRKKIPVHDNSRPSMYWMFWWTPRDEIVSDGYYTWKSQIQHSLPSLANTPTDECGHRIQMARGSIQCGRRRGLCIVAIGRFYLMVMDRAISGQSPFL